MDYPGNLFVIAAPSGAGKSSLVRALLAQDARLQLSVSHTTRAPRGQEQNGREYYFVSPAAFDAMVQADAFVEWAHVHNHRYGTSRQAIADQILAGADIVLEIDYQGAMQIKKLFPAAAIIFILPPSWEELRARLIKRGEDPEDVIALRLKNAAEEMAQAPNFDFVIINDLFERALADLQLVVNAQRLRYPAQRRARPETFQALRLP
ncbi:MAG: guanylate kinase [Hylemonella sp.]|jgi:guanylate kinase|uniref:guanylate kinase n=1 Tax=Hylemonella sp. TaxID=2066020 RepID=UPI00391BC751